MSDYSLQYINSYKCLVKKDGKWVVGLISSSRIYEDGNITNKPLAYTKDKTKYKFFTECMRYNSKIKLDIGEKIKYSDSEGWFYVIEEGGENEYDKGEIRFEYIIGK